jgi:hypothetical protein
MLESLPTIAAVIAALVAVANGLIVATVLWRRTLSRKMSRANGHDWAEPYELAITSAQKYIKQARDGTLFLDLRPGDKLGIDPVLFADLERSLNETNKKIRAGEISGEGVAAEMHPLTSIARDGK